MYDVIVVGSGNAALTAALAARQARARVLVLEKAPQEERGGNSKFTGGIVRFAYMGLEDILPIVPGLTEAEVARLDVAPYPAEAFYTDVMHLSQDQADPELTRSMVDRSYATVRWMQGLGVQFELYDKSINFGGRRSFPAGAVVQFWGGGPALMRSLFHAAEGHGVDIVYSAAVTGLLAGAGGRACGVRVQTPEGAEEIGAGSVVLGSGGFEASPEMRVRYLGPEWTLAKVRGTRHNTGELIDRCLELGAQPAGHWSGCHAVPVDAHSPDVGDPKLGDLTTRVSYPFGIMVNIEGRRFTDEGSDFKLYSYARMGHAILRQPRGIAYQLFDQQTAELLEPRYHSGSAPVTANTLDELAARLGVDRETLVSTVAEFNAAVHEGTFNPAVKDGKGTRDIHPPKSNWALRLEKPPFLAYAVSCGITFTYGGILTDQEGRVVDTAARPIPGLYATGEITGGIFYHNYPGGCGLTLGAVFGRAAGTVAAREALAS
ncbi:MAG: FAD-dependent tricarballylate dehydrogenase TcuA [Chloroflexi bacterium]|nr:FAD-dependent tricarballylate dehydrogenase TcuA [Chloroflexota bacterium]